MSMEPMAVNGTPLNRTIPPIAGSALGNIFWRNPAAVGRYFVAHFAVFRKHTADGGVGEALAVGDAFEANRFPSDALDQRRLRLHPFSIFFFEADRFAGAFAASLLASPA